MRPAVILGALAPSLWPPAAQAGDDVRAMLGFHRCYFEVPARPKVRTETHLVQIAPGYWEHNLRPASYALKPGSATFYRQRGAQANGPRSESVTAIWHEPIYMKVGEETVVDPGRAVLLRADNCWPN